MTLDDLLDVITKPTVLPAITFVVGGVCGFIGTRLTMTASERSAHKQRLYENSNSHTPPPVLAELGHSRIQNSPLSLSEGTSLSEDRS